MSSNREIANFFWHGEMSLYERLCISSFIKHNFIVNVWSYENLDLPAGANLCLASEILDLSELNTFKVWDPKTKSYNSFGGINSGFSDLFRITLLMKKGGWWFDSDVVCLKDESEFKKLTTNKNIIAGKEDDITTNGAILNIPTKKINDLLLKKCLEICNDSKNLKWGDVGPKLITNFIKENNLNNEIYEKNIFYPIPYKEIKYFFDPQLKEQCHLKCKNSHTIHLWNWMIIKEGLNKNILPNEHSYLGSLFKSLSKN